MSPLPEQPLAILHLAPEIDEGAVDFCGVQETLGEGTFLRLSTDSDSRASHRDLTQVSPIILTIAAAGGVTAGIAAKKLVELITDDLYKSAKKLTHALFKAKPELRREVRIELSGGRAFVRATVSSESADILEKALTAGPNDLVNAVSDVLDSGRPPSELLAALSAEDRAIANSAIARSESMEWVLFEYDISTSKWIPKAMLIQGTILGRPMPGEVVPFQPETR